MEHWAMLVGALAVPVLLFVLASFVEPDERGFGTHEKLGLPACSAMEIFGVPCPGCGVTTSVTLAAHGRFLDSIANQPFGFVVFLLALGALPWALFVHARGGDLWRTVASVRPRTWLVPGVLVLAAWLYKVATTVG